MILRFLLRVGYSLQAGQETSRSVYRAHVQVGLLAEHSGHLLELVLAKQAVIDKQASQAVADGSSHQRRGNGGIHSARKRAQRAFRP